MLETTLNTLQTSQQAELTNDSNANNNKEEEASNKEEENNHNLMMIESKYQTIIDDLQLKLLDVEKLNSDHLNVIKSLKSIEAEYIDYKDRYSKNIQELSDIQEKLTETEKKLNDIEEKLTETTQKLIEIQQTLIQTEQTLMENEKNYKSELTTLTSQLQDSQDLLQKNDLYMNILTEKNQFLEATSQESMIKITQLESTILELQTMINNINQNNQDHNSNQNNLNNEEKKQLKLELENSLLQLKQNQILINNHEEIVLELNNKIEFLQNAENELRIKHDTLVQQVDAYVADKNNQESEYLLLMSQFDTYKSQYNDESVNTNKSMNDSIEMEYNTMKTDLQLKQQEFDILMIQYTNMNNQNNELTLQYEEMTTKYNELNSKYDQLKLENKDANDKVISLTDKEKKLKLLLNKFKTLGQEREQELEKLTQLKSNNSITNSIAKRFSILMIVNTVLQHPISNSINYCLLSVDESYKSSDNSTTSSGSTPMKSKFSTSESLGNNSWNTSDSTTKGGLRWEEESVVREWLKSGTSTLLGNWPTDTIQSLVIKESQQTIVQLQNENKVLQTDLFELKTSFDAYKQRATETLKNLGSIKQKEQVNQTKLESEEINNLTTKINQLEYQNEILTEEKSQQQSCMDNLKKELLICQQDVVTLTSQLEVETKKNHELNEKYKRDITDQQKFHNNNSATTNSTTNSTSNTNNSTTDGSIQKSSLIAPIEILESNFNQIVDNNNNDVNLSNTTNTSTDLNQDKKVSSSTSTSVPPESPTMKSGTIRTPHIPFSKNTLLLQQHDSELRDLLNTLRSDNTNLNMEILELKSIISLNNEQVGCISLLL